MQNHRWLAADNHLYDIGSSRANQSSCSCCRPGSLSGCAFSWNLHTTREREPVRKKRLSAGVVDLHVRSRWGDVVWFCFPCVISNLHQDGLSGETVSKYTSTQELTKPRGVVIMQHEDPRLRNLTHPCMRFLFPKCGLGHPETQDARFLLLTISWACALGAAKGPGFQPVHEVDWRRVRHRFQGYELRRASGHLQRRVARR